MTGRENEEPDVLSIEEFAKQAEMVRRSGGYETRERLIRAYAALQAERDAERKGREATEEMGRGSLRSLDEAERQREKLMDAIRDMLDFAVGWCSDSGDFEKRLKRIEEIGNAALALQQEKVLRP